MTFKCPNCSSTFDTEDQNHPYVLEYHQSAFTVKLPSGKSFNTKSAIRKHLKRTECGQEPDPPLEPVTIPDATPLVLSPSTADPSPATHTVGDEQNALLHPDILKKLSVGQLQFSATMPDSRKRKFAVDSLCLNCSPISVPGLGNFGRSFARQVAGQDFQLLVKVLVPEDRYRSWACWEKGEYCLECRGDLIAFAAPNQRFLYCAEFKSGAGSVL
ncbi:hypothetical protein BGZ91_000037 [Linnemannia elongata]|nr:hypothetical protein BGZ91_000037 [Linnemannia elongata]